MARYTYKEHKMWCHACKTRATRLFWSHEDPPPCAACGGPLTFYDGQNRQSATVIGDEIDVMIPHGICHEDGTPKRYTSKADIRDALNAKGLVNFVRHMPVPGSDKSPHTVRHDVAVAILNPEDEKRRIDAWHENEHAAAAKGGHACLCRECADHLTA